MGKQVTLKEDNNRKPRSKSVIYTTARSESTSKSPAPSNRLTNKTTQNSLKNISSLQDSVSKKSSNKKKPIDVPLFDNDHEQELHEAKLFIEKRYNERKICKKYCKWVSRRKWRRRRGGRPIINMFSNVLKNKRI